MLDRLLKTLFLIFIFATAVNAQFDEEIVSARLGKVAPKVKAGEELKFSLQISIKDGWHIHADKPNDPSLIPSKVSLGDKTYTLAQVNYPKAKELKSDISDKPLVVFEGEVTITGSIKIPADAKSGKIKIPVVFGYQGCNDKTCMPPSDAKNTIEVTVEAASASATAPAAEPAKTEGGNTVIEQQKESIQPTSVSQTQEVKPAETQAATAAESSDFESRGLLLNLLIIFLGGLALNLTPCVYPLIPITIGYFGGQTEGRTSKLFVLGLLYVLGLSLTYSVVGVVTALSGSLFGALLQSTAVVVIICLIFVALALSMFGLYEFKLPDSWVMKAGGARSGMFGAFFMGLTMGIVAAPCVGPFVFSLITIVAKKADPFYGFLVFFILSLGLGFPYLILALFSGKLKSLPRAGLWMEAVKHIFGFIMIGMALYFAAPLIPREINKFVLPVYGVLASLYLLFFDKSANSSKGFKTIKTVLSILVIIASVYFGWPVKEDHGKWQNFDAKVYAQSIGKDKIIIDFWADWCMQCKELDAKTFSNEKVKEVLKGFTGFKSDLTKTNDEVSKIYKDFKIISLPTVLIFDSKGNEVKRITGFMESEEFLKIIEAVN
jgi:thioredoxin:protein disulfide reductase